MSQFDCLQDGVTLKLSGDLTFATSEKARQKTEGFLRKLSGEIVVDFSSVERTDSSALAFWLSCQRCAEQQGLTLQAQSFPAEMQQMAELVGISGTRLW